MAAAGTDPHVSLVVAVSENGMIGVRGGLPWRLPSDLKLFKKLTMGKPMIMGRKTFESIGKALPGRDNIVVTRNQAFAAEGVIAAANAALALEMAEKLAGERGADDISIIGGAEIYRALLPFADRIYKTEVHMAVEGDTAFPELDAGRWRETGREEFTAGPGDSADFSLVTLERTS